MFVIGLLLFFAAHSVSIIDEGWRNRMATRLGEPAWQGIYSLISLAGLALMIWGYGMARQVALPLYAPPVWARHLALLVMLPVFPLLIATYLPGRIQHAARHPMLLATMLWAVAHLLANGNLADVLLFGAFLTWAAVDRLSLSRRMPRPLPMLPAGKRNDLIALAGGTGIYLAFLFGLHQRLIGVPILPWIRGDGG
jgi:uncharacterized membrane protein